MKMTFTDDELKVIQWALKGHISMCQSLPFKTTEEEKDWLLLEKITGKNRFEIAEREK